MIVFSSGQWSLAGDGKIMEVRPVTQRRAKQYTYRKVGFELPTVAMWRENSAWSSVWDWQLQMAIGFYILQASRAEIPFRSGEIEGRTCRSSLLKNAQSWRRTLFLYYCSSDSFEASRRRLEDQAPLLVASWKQSMKACLSAHDTLLFNLKNDPVWNDKPCQRITPKK